MSDEILRRIEMLEKMHELASKSETESIKNGFIDTAKLDTLEQILEQIATRMGVSQSAYAKHYQALHNRNLGKYLDMASRIDETLAAQLDARELDGIDIGDEIPPLFVEKPEI